MVSNIFLKIQSCVGQYDCLQIDPAFKILVTKFLVQQKGNDFQEQLFLVKAAPIRLLTLAIYPYIKKLTTKIEFKHIL